MRANNFSSESLQSPSSGRRKIAIIGLDAVPPELLFQKLLDKLPNIKKMFNNGIHGNLLTCHPPITVPAWMVMMTGKNPGRLGIYGFRHRKGSSYNDGYIVNSTHVREPTVWEYLAYKGKKSVIIGVPPSYPPKPTPNCNIVSCFITPDQDREFTYPSDLKKEVLEVCRGNYIFDITFRTEDREGVKKELFEMTQKRFDVAEYLAKEKPWDFLMLHEIGFDRLHHAFWKYFDPSHPKYQSGNRYEHIDEEYYSMVDKRIGKLLKLFGEDCTTIIVSDHGSKAMKGAFCINQWLEEQGYLTFKEKPKSQIELEKASIDWARTKAWGWGGYYARIFFNINGREPQGTIEPSKFEKEKEELVLKLNNITDPAGRKMKNLVLEPDTLYGKAIGDKPDLMVYFDELFWRSAGTVGHESIYLSENDTGPDDSVHSMEGVFLMYHPKRDIGPADLDIVKIEDICPTLLELFGIRPNDEEMDGKCISQIVNAFG